MLLILHVVPLDLGGILVGWTAQYSEICKRCTLQSDSVFFFLEQRGGRGATRVALDELADVVAQHRLHLLALKRPLIDKLRVPSRLPLVPISASV